MKLFALELGRIALLLALGWLAATLFGWAGLPLAILLGAAIYTWPHGFKLGPLLLLERMDGFRPLGVYVAGWKPFGEHEPGTLRWSFEWIAPSDWSLFKPQLTDSAMVLGLGNPYSYRVRRLELPLLGIFTLGVSRDLLAAIEV